MANICMLVCCNGASTSNNRKATFSSVLEKNRENGLNLAHVALSDENNSSSIFRFCSAQLVLYSRVEVPYGTKYKLYDSRQMRFSDFKFVRISDSPKIIGNQNLNVLAF